jgi:hypothetical protein
MVPRDGRKNRVGGGGQGARRVEGPTAGPAWGEGKWAGAKRNSDFLFSQIIFKRVQIVLIQRWTYQAPKKFQIKYVFQGN